MKSADDELLRNWNASARSSCSSTASGSFRV